MRSLTALIEDSLRPGDVFIDIGAGNGVAATLAAARAVGREGVVLAIERDPERLARLRHNMRYANVTNVQALPGPELARLYTECIVTPLRALGDRPVQAVRLCAPGQDAAVLRALIPFLEVHRPLLFVEGSKQNHEGTPSGELFDILADCGYRGSVLRQIKHLQHEVILRASPAEAASVSRETGLKPSFLKTRQWPSFRMAPRS